MKTVTVDDYQRIRLPDAKPRTKFSYEVRDGTVTLTPLVPKEPPPAKVRFEKRGNYTVGVTGRPISLEAIKAALAEFP
jgi:hypothetical protein